MRRAHITSIGDANGFLKSYIKKYNTQFAIHLNSTKSVFETQPSPDLINSTLAVISRRIVDSGCCIKFNNKFYIPTDKNGKKVFLPNKSKVIVIQAFDGNTYINFNDTLYNILHVPTHFLFSKNFDPDFHEIKPTKKYIPPLNHPWRKFNIVSYFSNQNRRFNFGT